MTQNDEISMLRAIMSDKRWNDDPIVNALSHLETARRCMAASDIAGTKAIAERIEAVYADLQWAERGEPIPRNGQGVNASDRKMRLFVSGLAKLITVQQVADLLNATLCADQEDELSDGEVDAVETFFDLLAAAVPDAVMIATGGDIDNGEN